MRRDQLVLLLLIAIGKTKTPSCQITRKQARIISLRATIAIKSLTLQIVLQKMILVKMFTYRIYYNRNSSRCVPGETARQWEAHTHTWNVTSAGRRWYLKAISCLNHSQTEVVPALLHRSNSTLKHSALLNEEVAQKVCELSCLVLFCCHFNWVRWSFTCW